MEANIPRLEEIILKEGGCPVCEEGDVQTFGEPDHEDDYIRVRLGCWKCKSKWTEIFWLHSVEITHLNGERVDAHEATTEAECSSMI